MKKALAAMTADGGVHTRIDHEAGLRIGHEVAGFVLQESRSTGFGFSGS